jgi:YHS domain-containing protein
MPNEERIREEKGRQNLQESQTIDPVCGMEVEDRKTSLKEEKDGQEFYFCSESCRNQFRINPSLFQ